MAEGRVARVALQKKEEEKSAVKEFIKLKDKFPLTEIVDLQNLVDLFVFDAVLNIMKNILKEIVDNINMKDVSKWTSPSIIIYHMWFSVISADLRKLLILDPLRVQRCFTRPPLLKLFNLMNDFFRKKFPLCQEEDFTHWTNKWGSKMEEEGATVHVTSLNCVD